jgi:hypothetical protein
MPSEGERRYNDHEVAEILEQAANAEVAATGGGGSPDGLTLAELWKIGAEAGLSPDLVTRAATAIDARGTPARRNSTLGIPVGVRRVVPLDRALEAHEWERLVSMFRDTFGAHGRTSSDGGLRQWSNGNLRISTESTGDGWALRFSTRKSGGPGTVAFGGIMLLAAVIVAAFSLFETADADTVMVAVMFALAGGANLAWGAVSLPRWAAERENQFQALGEEAARIAAVPLDASLR